MIRQDDTSVQEVEGMADENQSQQSQRNSGESSMQRCSSQIEED